MPFRQTLILDIRSLPISIGGGIIFVLIGYLPPSKFPLKIRMVVGAIIGMVGTILLIFGQSAYLVRWLAPSLADPFA